VTSGHFVQSHIGRAAWFDMAEDGLNSGRLKRVCPFWAVLRRVERTFM
jgi:hypothetical protein